MSGRKRYPVGDVAELHAFLAYAYKGQWRDGQAAFNALARMMPDVADQIRGTKADPFHDDSRIDAFYDRLENLVGGAR